MYSLVDRAALKSKIIFCLLCISLLAAMVTSSPSYAVDTGISVDIAGSTAPDLQIDGSTSIVSSMPIILTGRVGNLAQIRIYVDGVFTATVPLTPADTTFSYSLWVGQGVHAVRFVGVSAFTSTDIEQNITVDFRMPDSTPSPAGGGTINTGSNTNTNGIIIGGNMPEQIQPLSSGGLPLPQWVVRILIPLDIINPAKVDETPRMLRRLVLILLGLPLVVFARNVLFLYRMVFSYKFLARKPPLPPFLRDSPLFWIRSLGVVFLIAAFMWVH